MQRMSFALLTGGSNPAATPRRGAARGKLSPRYRGVQRPDYTRALSTLP